MPLLAAAGHVDITPPVGLELAGWCFGPSKGIADRLSARALVLEEGSRKLVVVTLDLIGLGTPYANQLRSDIADALSITRKQIVVSCSHTHSGPGAMPLRRWGSIDQAYIDQLLAKVTTLVIETAGGLGPCVLTVAETEVQGICDNRRGDRGNLVDERLPVVTITGDDRKPIAVLYNFSCHPVAAHNDRNLISPDFPGYAAQSIRSKFPETEVLFTLGAAGDVNPTEFHSLDLARSYGHTIGDAIVGLMSTVQAPESEAESEPVLDATSRVVELPVAPLPSAEWLTAEHDRWEKEAERLRQEGGPHSKLEDALIKAEWASEALDVATDGRALSHLPMEITAVRMGPIALVSMPGELFVEIGMSIKKSSPFRYTAIVELANGSLAYLPTAEAYKNGGYEIDFSAKVYGLYMLTEQTQPIIEETVSELLAELAARSPDTQEDMNGKHRE
jgi:hypothetical protein